MLHLIKLGVEILG